MIRFLETLSDQRPAVRSSNGSYEFIDFRETAPAAAFQDMYNEDEDLSLYGGLARYKLIDGKHSHELIHPIQWRSWRASWFGALT